MKILTEEEIIRDVKLKTKFEEVQKKGGDFIKYLEQLNEETKAMDLDIEGLQADARESIWNKQKNA